MDSEIDRPTIIKVCEVMIGTENRPK
ncbi:hypothetical protein MACJ_003728 [Theileria orientalis]|uniref:Uncharacterized protein n=1 Tax=Theileria orientalis TaxID=68886 RepID=A0A976XK74_THEOR|nr:hypothetical protein MACJ_003728 [Theileria orientalis]